jgi:hypothetical protein
MSPAPPRATATSQNKTGVRLGTRRFLFGHPGQPGPLAPQIGTVGPTADRELSEPQWSGR